MRIVFASSSFATDGGGIAAYSRLSCQLLAAAGHEVLVISTDPDLSSIWEFPDQSIIKTIGIPVPADRRQQVESAASLFNEIVAFDPEVLISSNHGWLTSLFPCFAAHRIRISISHYYDGVLARGAALRPEHTDWIVSISHAGLEWLVHKTGATRNQVRVIYNTTPDVDPCAMMRHKAAQRELSIVYPGGGAAHKSPDVVLRILTYLNGLSSDWRLLWLGKEKFISRFAGENSLRRVSFTGLVPKAVAEDCIANAHCLLLPSRGEGCPMTLLEAVRAGTIPIVSDCPSAMREIVEDGVSGFVVPIRQPARFAQNLALLGKSPLRRNNMMMAARTTYENCLSPTQWYDKMLELLTTHRKGRLSVSNKDIFDPQLVTLWLHYKPSWKQPSVYYIRSRIELAQNISRCAIAGLKLVWGRGQHHRSFQ